MKLKILYFFTIVVITGCATGIPKATTYAFQPPADTNIVLPPAWAFGVLYGGYTNQKGTIETVNAIKKHDYPIDAYWIDSWFWDYKNKGRGPQKYIDFVADTISYPDRKAMWQHLQKNNVKGGFWVWDCIMQTGNEKAFDEFNTKGFFRDTYIETNPWHNNSTTTAMHETPGATNKGTLCGNIDFNNPAAVSFFKQKMKHFFDEGADFIKLDRTSEISVCKAMFEMSQEFGQETKGRGFMLSHSFGTERPEYKRYPTKWTDDTRSDWTIEKPLIQFDPWVPKVALKENIAMYTNPKNKTSDIPFLTNDLGGFDMGKTDKPEEELYIRWMQFSMFSPITEVFSQPENPTSNLAWNYSHRADTLFRFYAHLRMKLFPYLYSYAHLSRLKGENMLRKIPGQLYEYLLGNELLVAPVYEKGAVTRKVFLPEGYWINYWTDETLKGNAEYETDALIDRIPLFVKAGAIIPMRRYAASIEQGNNDMIELHIYPGDSSKFYLIEDDGISSDYLNGDYTLTVIELKGGVQNFNLTINPISGSYKNNRLKRDWKLFIHTPLKPIEMKVNGKNIQFNIQRNMIVLKQFQYPLNTTINLTVKL